MQMFDAQISVDGDGTVTVALSGEVDLSVEDDLTEVIVAASSGARVLRLDLSGLSFIDACGASVLTRCGLELAEAGGRLRIVAWSPQVQRVLEVVGLGVSNPAFDVPTR